MVDGTSKAAASTQIGGTAPAYVTGNQGLSNATALPGSSDTSAVISANSNLAAAFGTSPTYLALAEMGSLYDSGGTTSETITDRLQFTVDPNQLAASKDLILGLYHPTQSGTGGSLVFDVTINGADVVHQGFTGLSSATAYFTNHALDLGSVAGFAMNGPISVGVTLAETNTAANSGLAFGLLLGTSHA